MQNPSNQNKPAYGDFEEIEEKKPVQNQQQNQPEIQVQTRVRTPGKGQLIGIVTQRLGGNRMSVQATDNKIRNSRVPGRFSRRFWLRPGDAVMIEPWPDDDSKADIIHQYKGNEAFQLRKKGFLDKIKTEF